MTVRCLVCGKLANSYINLARHMIRTAEMYKAHVEFVEGITEKNFMDFAIHYGGITRLARILEANV